MKEFDNNGLRLAEFQARLFEESLNFFNCSSLVFVRKFLYSSILETLDNNDSSLISFTVDEALEIIKNEFKSNEYGKDKYGSNAMFWMGYIYRYISYTREVSTKFLMKLFPPKELFEVYYSYHTQSNEWVVSSLLSLHNLNENYFDKNYRLKEIIKNSNKTCL